jgi:anti-anti-sigma regulatory factor
MREHGLVQSAADLGLHGHVCWTYDDDAELIRAAAAFLADGVRLGQRLIYVASGPLDRLHAQVEEMARVNRLVREGALEILSLDATYAAGTGTDPEALLAIFATATEQALADGFTGLRVVGDGTTLAADPRNWAEHTRWEAVSDRFMASKPYSGLCCYDSRVLPPQILQDLCAVHPVAHAPAENVPFRLYADRDALVLDGEVDYFAADRLRRVLGAAAPPGAVLDLGQVEFVDHHAAVALAESGLPLRAMPHSMRRTCELLGLRA